MFSSHAIGKNRACIHRHIQPFLTLPDAFLSAKMSVRDFVDAEHPGSYYAVYPWRAELNGKWQVVL